LTVLEKTIDCLSLIRLVYAIELGVVILLALLVINLILINAPHKFFLELIEAKKAIKSFELNIFVMLRCDV